MFGRPIAVVVVFALAAPLSAQVVWSSGNGHTYLRSATAGTQDQIRDEARSLGGYLVSITSQAEKNFILSNPALTAGAPWIGLSDEFQDGTWRWDSGEPLGSFADWCTGEPNGGTAESAAVWSSGQGGCWTDVVSSPMQSLRHGIIEIPLDTAQAYVQEAVQHLTFNGNASPGAPGTYRIAGSAAGDEAGSFFRNGLKQVVGGFVATFTFRVTNPTGGGGEGFAWVLHADDTVGSSALGGSGASLGYGGLRRSLAVEFDLHDNGNPNLNQISVHTAGDGSNVSSEAASIGRVTPPINMSDGQEHTVRIWYVVGATSFLEIYLDDLATPLLTVPYDLLKGGTYLDGRAVPGISLVNGSDAWWGLTGSTSVTRSQDIDVSDARWNVLGVENGGFEADAISEGANTAPSGWLVVTPSYARNPLPSELPWAAYEGKNVGRAENSTFFQHLPDVLQGGRAYELRTRLCFSTANAHFLSIILLADFAPLATEAASSIAPTAGTFVDVAASFVAAPDHPSIGVPLDVQVSGSGPVFFDNVTLAVTHALRVPEDHATIQAAINAAGSGQTVLVGPGTYSESIDTLNKNLAIRSTGGAGSTTIVAVSGPAARLTNGSFLEGFTTTGGLAGVRVEDGTVSACVITGNNNGVFTDNGTCTVTNCVITGNTQRGLWITGGSPTVTITNCTVDAAMQAVDVASNMAAVTATNCIFLRETGSPTIGGSPAITFSNVGGGYPGVGNIDSDPLFVDRSGGDYHLQFVSPCVDAGTSGPGIPARDFEGNLRSCPDIGAYETPGAVLAGRLLGQRVLGPVTLDAQTSNTAQLGVVALNGSYYVSARGPGAVPPHKIYVFDEQGQLTNTFDQNLSVSSPWGYRDGATDGTSLIFGYEGGIEVVDPISGNRLSTIQADNGPQNVTTPFFVNNNGSFVLTVERALAYDPSGNFGDGSLWVANFETDLYEIRLDGTIINQFPWNGSWSIYGLALDPVTGRLWASSSPNAGDIVEIDPATGQETGVRIPRSPGLSQGGLSGVVGSGPGENAFDLVGIDQGVGGDLLTRYRVHRYSSVDGTLAPILGVGFDGGPLQTGICSEVQVPQGASTMEIGYFMAGPAPLLNAPAVLVASIGNDAFVNATFFVPDFLCPLGNGLLAWTSPAPTQPPVVLGDGLGFGPAIGLPLPLASASTSGPRLVIPLGAPLPALRFQTLYLEPAAPLLPPLMATNAVRVVP